MKAQPNTKLDSERIAALGIIADRLGLNFHDALVRAVDEFVLTRSPSMERPGTVGLLTGWPNASQPSSPIYGDPVTGEQGLREKDWKNLIRQGLAKDCFRGKDARAASDFSLDEAMGLRG